MGCGNGKADLTPIEARFFNGEQRLGFGNCEAIEVDLNIRKYSHMGVINENQWMNIYRHLKLAQSQGEVPLSDQIKAFYQLFKQENTYNLQELLVLGILLSMGSIDVKAKLLFEVFDVYGTKTLRRDAVGTMHDVMYKIAVKRAKVLIDKNDPNKVTEMEQEEYMERLKSGREKHRQSFIQMLLADGDSVTLIGFIETFKNKSNLAFLNSTEFRKGLKKNGMRIKEKDRAQKVEEGSNEKPLEATVDEERKSD